MYMNIYIYVYIYIQIDLSFCMYIYRYIPLEEFGLSGQIPKVRSDLVGFLRKLCHLAQPEGQAVGSLPI